MEKVNCSNKYLNVTLDELNRTEAMTLLPVMVFYVVIMLIGLVGNAFVLYIYKYKFKRSSARVYILCLAILDFSVCLVGVPYHVLDLTWMLTYKSAVACKLLSFFISSFTLSSVFVLLVVGLDRYCKVCRPLKKQIVDFGNRKACIIAIVCAVVISIPNAVLYGNRTIQTSEPCIEGVSCFVSDFFVGSMFSLAFLGFWMLLFVFSVAFLVVIYGLIGRKIYRHDKLQGSLVLNKNKRACCACLSGNSDVEADDAEMDYDEGDDEIATCMKSEDIDREGSDDAQKERETLMVNADAIESKKADYSASQSQSKTVNKSRTPDKLKTAKNEPLRQVPSTAMIRHGKQSEKNTRKITLMMMTITIVFIASYLPFIAISLVSSMHDEFYNDMEYWENLATDFLLRFYLINNVANPIIYSFWDKKFRKECSELLKRIFFGCCERDHDEHCTRTTLTGTKHTDLTLKTV